MPGSPCVTELRDFYATPLGRLARRLLRRQVRNLWPQVERDEFIAGRGYATPFLRTFLNQSWVAALMPAYQGVTIWPPAGPCKTALVNTTALPRADGSVDRFLLSHALEFSGHPDAMMEEVWRSLRSGGQLLLIVSNRRGLWAGPESTPFGHGRPYSRSQLEKLLAESGFEAEEWRHALFMPPLSWRPILRFAVPMERIGERLWPAFGGVNLVLARKQVYRALPKGENHLTPARLAPVPAIMGLGRTASRHPPNATGSMD